MLDEDGVTGEVAMDDGRLTGVQVTVEEGTRVSAAQKASQKICPLKEKPSTQMLSSPEGGQYLCAPAFPSLWMQNQVLKKRKDLWSPCDQQQLPHLFVHGLVVFLCLFQKLLQTS